MNFANAMTNQLNNRKTLTENGAVAYETSGKALLDINFQVAALRNASEGKIINMFSRAYFENPKYAVKWLFYARDVRGGMGERRLFRICLSWLMKNYYAFDMQELCSLIEEYGRYDDIFAIYNGNEDAVCEFIKTRLAMDMTAVAAGKPISLLAKWMPSVNTSSAETRKLARDIVSRLKITEKDYRKMLSALRNYLNVVEKRMCAKEWSEINYETVPSRANLIYRDAFMRNDAERRSAYLSSLEKGEAKINGTANFPHDIISKYSCNSCWYRDSVNATDATLEALWKALPNYIQGDSRTIVVADGSGSMTSTVTGNVTCLDVANALAIYFAERLGGDFKNKYITFSRRPQMVNLNGQSLHDNLMIARRYKEVADTNIESVFDLILETAIMSGCKQEEIPNNILILSDMQFNGCVTCNHGWVDDTLFEKIAAKYASFGYKLPRLVFWNIAGRVNNTVPVRTNELGVTLVSGFSPAIANMVLSGETDPYRCLITELDKPRYDRVEMAFKLA